MGGGTGGSRILQQGGAAVQQGVAIEVKDVARRQAADMLEAAAADLILDTGELASQGRGDPDTSVRWGQVAGTPAAAA